MTTNLLKTTIGTWDLVDPFMIASSHWTATEAAFRQLASLTPSAVTLKTTSNSTGGTGNSVASGEGAGRRRVFVDVLGHAGQQVGRFSDGPKEVEFWNNATTAEYLATATRLLPSSRMGLSLLQGEDYSLALSELADCSWDYVELNWKYALRKTRKLDQLANSLRSLAADLGRFRAAFPDCAAFMKVPREALPFVQCDEFAPILEALAQHQMGAVVANTMRWCVPPSKHQSAKNVELNSGVVMGETLFLDTYTALRSFSQRCRDLDLDVPLIASGGITNIGNVLDSLVAGASAVQLCTAMDHRGRDIVAWLREQLSEIAAPHGGLQAMIASLRADESGWGKAVRSSEQLSVDEGRLADEAMAHAEKLHAWIQETLERELENDIRVLDVTLVDEPVACDPYKWRVYVPRGNVSAGRLTEMAGERLNLLPVNLSFSSGGLTGYIDKDPGGFDFAILAESHIAPLNDRGCSVVKLANVGRSTVELMGVSDVSQDGEVHHFSGVTSLHALAEVKTEYPNVSTRPISRGLLPLLRFWRDSGAVLAKPPMSRLYGTLVRQGGDSNKWRVLRNYEEPLWLVAREPVIQDVAGKHVAAMLIKTIEESRMDILAAPAVHASKLLASQADYFRHLLTAR